MKMKFEITALLLDYRSLFAEALKYIQENPEYEDVKDHVLYCFTLAAFVDKHVPSPGQALLGGCMVHAILEEIGFVPVEKMSEEEDASDFNFPCFEAWEPMEMFGPEGPEVYNVYDVEGLLKEIRKRGGESSAKFYADHAIPMYLLDADEGVTH